MKKSDIKVGGFYIAKISGKLVTVRVDEINAIERYSGTDWKGQRIYKNGTGYQVTNLSTGRVVTFRSATKFRSESKEPAQ